MQSHQLNDAPFLAGHSSEKELKPLNVSARNGKISAEERSVRREQIIVECLLKDYTKRKGLVEADGRKK